MTTIARYAPMVKWTSCPASNWAVRVRLLVGVLEMEKNGRATRLATGSGWKPGEHDELPCGFNSGHRREERWSPSADNYIYGVCGVAVAARLAVNQKVAVRLRSGTPNVERR